MLTFPAVAMMFHKLSLAHSVRCGPYQSVDQSQSKALPQWAEAALIWHLHKALCSLVFLKKLYFLDSCCSGFVTSWLNALIVFFG